ncbi:hypothetical protein SEA_KENNA_69 [Gordonia phage Kenna]|uniref:DUF1508 domain-containing protein n=2 Tax=Getalongvirus kenna TaxID=2734201 RepID=A0A3S9UPY1_9CAUD|nr:hypothetical protein HOU97_gp69 [Gordonia phage Kenna]AZS12345.1 hypothetical protein SEA_KENNA_69 [Gordonia phage Kenna]QCG77232.1 hypothetical protein SEA_LUTUM_75 [Gordonia phage Lutum]
MIVFEGRPAQYRGTIEVYAEQAVAADQQPTFYPPAYETEWRWRCRSRNGQILAQGEGYNRKSGALNAIDAQYSGRFVDEVGNTFAGSAALGRTAANDLEILPWRLVVRDRHGDITTTGAVY